MEIMTGFFIFHVTTVIALLCLARTNADDDVNGAKYKGCFKDTSNRDLAGVLVRDFDGNTPQKCVDLCKDEGFRYAGVQAGYACLCGNSYGTYGTLPETSCRSACTGDESLFCGGGWANAIYKISKTEIDREEVNRCLKGWQRFGDKCYLFRWGMKGDYIRSLETGTWVHFNVSNQDTCNEGEQDYCRQDGGYFPEVLSEDENGFLVNNSRAYECMYQVKSTST